MLITPTVVRTTNVLAPRTHNSVRSVLNEGMPNHQVKQPDKDVRVCSASSAPGGRLSPFALGAPTNAGIDTAGYRSKSRDGFMGDGAAQMRVVITACDSAAAEACPYWPGSPVKMHRGYADLSNAPGGNEGKRQAFELARQTIGHRMLQLLTLSLDILSNTELQTVLERIAQVRAPWSNRVASSPSKHWVRRYYWPS